MFNISIIIIKFCLIFVFIPVCVGCVYNAKNNDNVDLLLSISTHDISALEKVILEVKNINYSIDKIGNTPLSLAMRVGNSGIIIIMLGSGANIESNNILNIAPIDDLFKYNDVDTIKKVLSHVNKESYKYKLGYHIYSGFNTSALYKRDKKINTSKEREYIALRMEAVSRFITDELANDRDIAKAISLLCSTRYIKNFRDNHLKYYREYFEYLKKHIVSNTEQSIECIS